MEHADDFQYAQGLTLDTAIEACPRGEPRALMLSKLVSEVYVESDPPRRARLLECLLKPLGPLALGVVSAGAFGGFLTRRTWSHVNVSIDDALRFGAEQIFELTRFVEQCQPEALGQLAAVISESPLCLTTLSGSLLLLALRSWLPQDNNVIH